MFDMEKLDQSIQQYLGSISKEQEEILNRAFNHPIEEKELFEQLNTTEEKFGKFLQSFHSGKDFETIRKEEEAKEKENEVFKQEVSEDGLTSIAGGMEETGPRYRCNAQLYRNIYGYNYYWYTTFPDCAKSVEDGSWCGDNDACYAFAILYKGMTDCAKAWK